MRVVRGKPDITVGLVFVLLGIFGVLFGYYLGIRFLPYVCASFSIGALGYIANAFSSDHQIELTKRSTISLDLIILLGVAILALISWRHPGVPELFYWLSAILILLTSIRILLRPSLAAAVHIVLLTIVLRASFWFSAPDVGRDPRKHVGIVQYIIESGELLTSPEYYYRDFPVAHSISSVMSLLTDLPAKQSYFLGVGVPTILAIFIIICYVRRLQPTDNALRVGLIAGMLISVSPYHNVRVGRLIPQAFAFGLLCSIILLILLPRNRRNLALIFLITGTLVATHNVPLLLLTLLFGSLLLFQTLYHSLFGKKTRLGPSIDNRVDILLTVVPAIAIIEYWHQIDLSRLQYKRIISIFLFAGETAIEDIETANLHGEVFGLSDPVLHIGIGLFLLTAMLTAAFLNAIREILGGQFNEINSIWTPASLLIFGVIGVGIVSVGTGVITRLIVGSLIVLVPVIASTLDKFAAKKIGIIFVCVLLLTVPIVSLIALDQGQRSYFNAPTERAAGDTPVYLMHSEKSTLNFASHHGDSLRSTHYVSSSATYNDIPEGAIESSAEFRYYNLSTKNLEGCEGITLSRKVYYHKPGVNRPVGMDQIYQSGSAELMRC